MDAKSVDEQSGPTQAERTAHQAQYAKTSMEEIQRAYDEYVKYTSVVSEQAKAPAPKSGYSKK